MNTGEIYMIKNLINNKIYIGQTVSYLSSGRKYGTQQRWNKHISDAKNFVDDCKAFCNAIRKYGKDNFSVEILVFCNIEMLNFYECKFINLYNTISPKGYNIESGGTKGKRMHQETKEKLSKSRRFQSISEDDKEKLLEAMEHLQLDEIPFGINFTHHIKNNYNGFTVRKSDGKLKSIISNGKTLTEKLELSLKYLDLYKKGNLIGLTNLDKQFEKDSKIVLRNSRLCEEAKSTLIKLGIDIDDLPLNIRYEKRKSRFFVCIDGKNKYFEINNPEKSLEQAIEYIQNLQKRESV